MKQKNNFYLKALLVSGVTAGVLFGCSKSVRVGWDPQLLRSSEYKLFVINKLRKDPVLNEYIAYKSGENKFFPADSIFIKKVSAIPGDKVTVSKGFQRINDGKPAFLHLIGTLEKTLTDFDREETVKKGEIWVMGTTKNSYDSRYFGGVAVDKIIGKAYPIF